MKGRKPSTIKTGTGKGALTRAPAAPSWLGAAARAEWKRVASVLVERRVLTLTDLACLEAFCAASGRIKELEVLIQANPGDVKLYRSQNQSIQTVRQIAAELGLTPVSRSRPAVSSDDQSEDELLDF